MKLLTGIKIGYWAVFKPEVFDEFVRLYTAKKNYNKKVKAHSKCLAEKLELNIARRRFNAALRG